MLTVATDNLQGLVSNILERMGFVITEAATMTAGEVLA